MVVVGRFARADEAAEYDLVPSSRDNTLALLSDIFDKWEPKLQAAPIKMSPSVASLAAAVPGLLIAFKFRNLLKMQRQTLRSVPLPLSSLVPGAVAGLYHRNLVTNDILL